MLPGRKLIVVFFVIFLVFFTLSYQPSPTSASTDFIFLVDSTEDLADFAPGNSVCSVGHETKGPCTLRAAITEANLNIGSAPVKIMLSPGIYTLTIPGGGTDTHHNGDLDIYSTSSTNKITIEPAVFGAEVVINTAPLFNDRILEIGNANVKIEGIVFSGAHLEVSPSEYGGGAIINRGNLELVGTKFVNNKVSCKPGENCTSHSYGGAIQNFGELSIFDSSFVQNSADQGGSAIFTNGPSVNISYSSFIQNLGSTIVNYSTLSILNSTLSGGQYGIHNSKVLRLFSCTLTNFSRIILNDSDKTVYVRDSIFSTQGQNSFNDDQGVWNSGGYNIFSDDSWPGDLAAGDLENTDPKLGILGYYGGPTPTHPLQQGSPAIDHRPGNCGRGQTPLFEDQRHFPRNDGKCDTGAFELGHTYLPLITR